MLKRSHVFWEARPAEARTWVNELVANSRIRPHALSHQFDVGPNGFRDIGDLIDEADLRRKHRVGGILSELGASRVHEHELVAVSVKSGVHTLKISLGVFRVRPDNNAIRAFGVANG